MFDLHSLGPRADGASRAVLARCDEAVSITDAVQRLGARLGSAAVAGIGISEAPGVGEGAREDRAHGGEAHGGEAHEGQAREGQTREGQTREGQAREDAIHDGQTPESGTFDDAASADPQAAPLDPGAPLVDLMAALSMLVSAAEAVSARAAVQLDRIRREQEAATGLPAKRRGRGVAAEVGLARRESAHRGRSFLGLAKVLCTEMPHTMTRLAQGALTPWRATLLAKESACLELEDRRRLDRDLCADPQVLAGLGDRAVGAAAARWAAREDPASVVARRSRAEADRRVSIRPAPDTMVWLKALLPVGQGVAAYRALSERADAARAAGDGRSRGQVMADALTARLTGAEEGAPPGVLVNLVMTDTALFSGGDEPGWLPGHGPVPASVARDLVANAARAGERHRQQRRKARRRSAEGSSNDRSGSDDQRGGDDQRVGESADSSHSSGSDDRRSGASGRGLSGDGGDNQTGAGRRRRSGVGAFLRRLYIAPKTGALVAMDSRSRRAPDGLSDLIELRDLGSCRVPWCDAPARHDDHVIAHAKGGPTSATNHQRGCEAHNYAKEAPGWSAVPIEHPTRSGEAHNEATANGTAENTAAAADVPRHEVVTRTPSGHVYRSTAPPLPGAPITPTSTREWSPHDRSPLARQPLPDPSPGEVHLAEILSRWRAA